MSQKKRLLAAIMFTDIKGYTALMNENEEKATIVRQRHRQVFQFEHDNYHGEILQYFGDGTLSIFKSAVEAVICAIKMQETFQEKHPVPLRVGIHLGDIVLDGDEIYGDAVNIASRVESLGVSGSILISDKLNFAIKNHEHIVTQSLGQFEFKNIKAPIEIFAVTNSGLRVPKLNEMKGKIKEKKKSIAVLPFVNMSTDPENEYFSDGVTEEIINVLAKINSLNVTSRTSAFHFKGKNIDIQEMGSALNVSILLEGSVRKSGDKVRITTQLINVEDGFHIWSETYNHQLLDIFQAQDEIATAVAEKMREHIGHFEISEPKERNNHNISAYNLYLKSRFNFNKFQKNDILLAVEQIEEVITMDPSCPFYHASKAIYYGYMGLLNIIPKQEAFSVSKVAAEKAITLDAADPEANYAMGIVSYFFEKDLDKAQLYGNLALKNRPNYTNALLGGSVIDVVTQNYKSAIARVKKAIEIDPLTPNNRYYYAAALLRMGRYKEALVEINTLLKLVPHHTNSYFMKGMILTRLGQYEEAVEHYKTVPSTKEKTEIYYSGIGIAYATQGNYEAAKKYLDEVMLDEQNFNVAAEENPTVIINIYLGNLDLAFEEIEKDLKANKYYLNFYKENPAFKLLIDDPRYEIFDKVFKTKGKNEETLNSSQAKYQRSGLSEVRIHEINSKLLELMVKEKPFLEASISLKSLSESLNESANHISQVINDKHNINFFDFVNSYRIDEMERIIAIPSKSNLTLLALAYESGFNSKTTFNAAFKKLKGQSPKAYFKNLDLL